MALASGSRCFIDPSAGIDLRAPIGQGSPSDIL
jgi:hypothetical protein